MQQVNKHSSSHSPNNNLFFISDINLRNKIKNAIKTMGELYLLVDTKTIPNALFLEIRRIIILYSASIIEALLLYVYKKKKLSSQKTDYIEVTPLKNNFQINNRAVIVLAKQISKEREERELMLDILVRVFKNEKIIPEELCEKIERIKNVRNTFHLSKSRQNLHISTSLVKEANDAVLATITALQIYLKI